MAALLKGFNHRLNKMVTTATPVFLNFQKHTLIEGKQGRGDDTSLNGIQLLCGTKHHRSNYGFAVTSGYGPWGGWSGTIKCGHAFFLAAFSLQVEKSQGRGDDTAANYVKFRCKSVNMHWPGYEIGGHGFWGHYGGWSTCPYGTAICGLRTKIEAPIRGDDTALNDVLFYCCK
ncbi:unnamed protein product [Mytilus edulis]|uniref:Uncharacterized protein n=1 Tax=Mytilus edulis TaxID=6550 RepID=A0A8S3S8H1_MYTED|nr:unnamed protein product [Mytilus edulis]